MSKVQADECYHVTVAIQIGICYFLPSHPADNCPDYRWLLIFYFPFVCLCPHLFSLVLLYVDLSSRRVWKWAVHWGSVSNNFPSTFPQWYQQGFCLPLPPFFFFLFCPDLLLPPSLCGGLMLQAYNSATKWFSTPRVSGDRSSWRKLISLDRSSVVLLFCFVFFY